MIKNVLLTGGTGFIGRNIKEYLKNKCNLYIPTREELNLFSEEDVKNYIKNNKIDIVIHSANPNPVKNCHDKVETMFEDSLRIFMTLYNAKDYYEYMYTIGSGAEYDKSRDIVLAKESEVFDNIPNDSYGFAKYIMNKMVYSSNKHCNLRIFACFGPTDHESKFITHVINCCLKNESITIKQNCIFDYMHVSDLARIIEYFIYNKPKYNSYNVCTSHRVELLEIAREVCRQLDSKVDIKILKEGMNREYTGDNRRLLNELQNFEFIPINKGIELQIKAMKGE